jgi:hypothetical protein
MYALNRPEVLVSYCEDKIDQTGRVTDTHTREQIRELLEALVIWTRRLRVPQHAEQAAY